MLSITNVPLGRWVVSCDKICNFCPLVADWWTKGKKSATLDFSGFWLVERRTGNEKPEMTSWFFAQIWGAVNETWICQFKKITTATKSNETDFNEARLSFRSGSVCLDPSGQRGPTFSSFGNSKNKEESKVLSVMYSSFPWIIIHPTGWLCIQ